MNTTITEYNQSLSPEDAAICNLLEQEISRFLTDAESKIWHGHPVWFLDGNPVVGYSKMKDRVQLLFWSGQSFSESALKNLGRFKAAQVSYMKASEVDVLNLHRWLQKAREIQWDYKNLVKNKGELSPLTENLI
jgi:hypothetical protein